MATLVHQSPPLYKPQDIFAILLSSYYLLLKGVDNEVGYSLTSFCIWRYIYIMVLAVT